MPARESNHAREGGDATVSERSLKGFLTGLAHDHKLTSSARLSSS